MRILAAMVALTIAATAAAAGNIDLVTAARQQIGVTVIYDGSYRVLAYPGGDVPRERGVCTDVIVRALRSARALDLQQLVHEDMSAHFHDYPARSRWGAREVDWNIDHRRVPNLMKYFDRSGYSRPITSVDHDYLPGDIVAWDLGGGTLHIGMVSDRVAVTGTPLVIHNIGAGAREEDVLRRFRIIGHYRLGPSRAAQANHN